MAPTKRWTSTLSAVLVMAASVTAWGAAWGAAAEARVLLVGVGRYPGLDLTYQMTAPAQDIRRLASSLAAGGLEPSRITRLTDSGLGRGPDRTAVLAALADLEQAAGRGDRILVYFSGHGGQRPATRPDREPDGLEEIWLTADARVDTRGMITGGYVSDFEIAASIRRMRKAGADVWLVVDACYAGGVTRSAGGQVKAGPSRSLVAVRGDEDADPILVADEAAEPGMGRFAAFYAAGADSLALAGPDGSAFTNALARALDGGRTSSLADLAAGVLAVDARLGVDAPRPVFEGDLEGGVLTLDRAGARRFALRHPRGQTFVAAGVEEGLSVGDWIETEDAEGRALGAVKVVSVDLGAARLEAGSRAEAVAGRFRPATAPAATPAGRLLAAIGLLGGRWSSDLEVTARLERPGASSCEAPVDPTQPRVMAKPVLVTALPRLAHCDRLYVRIGNRGSAPLDVSILYLAADGAVIGPGLHPVDDGRIRPGEHRDVAFRIVSESAEVTERIALVATPARSRFALDLRYLAGSAEAPAASRGMAQDWWGQVLGGGPLRGAVASAPEDTAVAVTFPVRVASLTENVRR